MTAHLPDPSLEAHTLPAKPHARLDKHLADLCPDLSRSFIQKMISDGRVRVNGRAVRAGYRLKASDVVVMDPQAEQPEIPEPRPFDLAIVYEDAEVLVVDKPGRSADPIRAPDTGAGPCPTLCLPICLTWPRWVIRPGPG